MNSCPKSSQSGCSFPQALVDHLPHYDSGHKKRRKKKRRKNKLYE